MNMNKGIYDCSLKQNVTGILIQNFHIKNFKIVVLTDLYNRPDDIILGTIKCCIFQKGIWNPIEHL